MTTSPRESTILWSIRLALGNQPDLALWRLNQGGTMKRGAHMMRGGLSVNGAPDLIGILGPTGRWFCLEVKSAKGRLSNYQTMFLRLIRDRGGFACVVHSIDEAMAALARARMGALE